MKFTKLFFNAMRMASKIDCRRFAVEAGYQEELVGELCDGVPARRPANDISAEQSAAETQWRTLPH